MDNENSNISRRDFTRLSALALGSLPVLGFESPFDDTLTRDSDTLQVYLFSKHLQFLDYEAMSSATAEMGFSGLDLTVRPKGHVAPERVKDDLPLAAEAMKKHGLSPAMMTTNVLSAQNSEDVAVLEAASAQGFTHYRTGWLKYPENHSIPQSQSAYGNQFKLLETLNKDLGLIGCYQNHAGKHVGAPIWDLHPILAATANENMGCQYDIRHAVVEGGGSWELGLRHIQPFIKSIVIKDFKWGQVAGKWQPINTPLGEGMVDFKRYFALLKTYNIKVPVSLHLEYDLGGAEHGTTSITIAKKEIFRKMKKDLDFLRTTWRNA